MRISKITIGRLFNLGHYEHVRYEVSVDVEPSDNPREALTKLESAINGLAPKCPVSDYDLESARRTLAKPVGQLEDYEVSNLPLYKKRIEEFEAWHGDKQKARAIFESLGGESKYTDAKDQWEENQ
jgi:hypothetical protein